MGSARRWGQLACVTAAISVVAGCSTTVGGTPVRQPLPAEADCAKVSAPMSTIERLNVAEPVMRIPTPEGWERSTELDSELIRYTLGNPSMTEDGFAPNVIVTLETVPANASAEEVLAAQWDAMASVGVTDIVPTSDTPVCGFPAQRVTYSLPQMGQVPARSGVAIAVVTTGATRFTSVVGLQTTKPQDPAYVEDSTTILDGFQILPVPDGDS